MANFGSVGEYDPEKEEWIPYTERLDEYFIANEVEDETKKRAILLSSCGHSTYQIARQLFAPTKLSSRTYTQVVERLTQHFSPKPKDIVQRCKFNARVRLPGETVATYCAELRNLAQFCDFGESLENMLRDRLVCGISDKAMQQRLLSEPDLTFQKAYDLAVLLESVKKDTAQLQSEARNSTAEIHAVRGRTGNSRDRSRSVAPRSHQVLPLNPCYRCGGKHNPARCRYKEENCHFCGKKGHIARVCRRRQQQQQQPRSSGSKLHDARYVSVKSETSSSAETRPPAAKPTESPTVIDDPVYSTFQLSTQGTDPLLVTLVVDKAELEMEIDTGASVSVIGESTYHSVWHKDQRPVLQKSTAQLRTYTQGN